MNYLTTEDKQNIFEKHGSSKTDTGSYESQVALFTERIQHLTLHLKDHKKDFSTERALLRIVGKRRRLLNKLKKDDIERYRKLIADLKLRR
ncbi:MAG: 30S ribosomal protein S15 [Bacteroidales bacterium]|nr:30S ribosomal protein S15 [Bacteroidales bacterium]